MRTTSVLLALIWLLVACGTRSNSVDGPAEQLAPTEVKDEPPTAPPPRLPDLGPAPELLNDTWLNTNGEPLRLADFRGKVVLLEFWTFG